MVRPRRQLLIRSPGCSKANMAALGIVHSGDPGYRNTPTHGQCGHFDFRWETKGLERRDHWTYFLNLN